jgi:hypothetical protein
MDRSWGRSGARSAILRGGWSLAALALAAALAGCGPVSPLAGTDPFELSVKRALNAELDRGGPLSKAVDVRCVRLGRAFECDADMVVDASFFRERYRGRLSPGGCWTAAPVAFKVVAGRRSPSTPMSPLHGCVR